jgi:hypothetical protein
MLHSFEEAVDHGVAEAHGGGGELVQDGGVRVRVVHTLAICTYIGVLSWFTIFKKLAHEN